MDKSILFLPNFSLILLFSYVVQLSLHLFATSFFGISIKIDQQRSSSVSLLSYIYNFGNLIDPKIIFFYLFMHALCLCPVVFLSLQTSHWYIPLLLACIHFISLCLKLFLLYLLSWHYLVYFFISPTIWSASHLAFLSLFP